MAQFSYWKVLTRRKTISTNNNQESKLSRVMNVFDLTTLGIGATLGVGVYVLAGHVARDQAGPSVVLSFAIAAITSLLAGMCYAEFGARVPKAGSAYIYSYVCIGEFIAFIVGWNLILEYIIGSASVSRGISLYLDTLINDTLKNTFIEISPISWGFLGLYFDWFAFAIAFSFGICLAFGIHTSTIINNLFTILNIIIVIIVVIAGAIKADIKNWQIDPSVINSTTIPNQNLGSGGFFPFGFEGTIRGAATCFFGFVGFDCIATTGEEVKDPQRAIPKSILFTLLTIFLAYFSVATVLTLMWPYYLQDVNAPLPFVFQEIGWPALKWIVTIGGMIGLIASLFGAMFPLPRIIYAMSQDGLIFKSLGKISTRFKTPVTGTICAALLTGLMAGLFDLTQLVNMLSIGTLLAYTVVAISITILRFMDNLDDLNENQITITPQSILKQIINFKRLKTPNDLSTRIVGTILLFYCLCCFAISLMIMYVPEEIISLQPWAIGIVATLLIILLLLLFIISIQPREELQSGFKVPFVPITPGISIFVNIYLMLQLDIYTWIRFGIWMIIGLIIYLLCICLYKRNQLQNENVRSMIPISNGRVNILGSMRINGTLTAKENSYKTFIQNETNNNNNGNTSIENQVTLKKSPTSQSLDEIISESELSHNHTEMKNSNGKTFFIENSSIAANDKLEKKSLKQNPSVDDEDPNSAIAVLDDIILKSEESIKMVHDLNDFNRKTSVDSEMIPSFIEASIIATVHKSESLVLEEENENIEERTPSPDHNDHQNVNYNDFIILNRRTESFILDLNRSDNSRKESQSEIVKEIKNSMNNQQTELRGTIIESKHEEPSEIISAKEIEPDKNVLNEDITPDPLHSKSFKDKLSELILSRPRFLPMKSRPNDNETNDANQIQNAAKLLETMIINVQNIEISNNEDPITSFNEENSIPKPPKFDPILYNTIGRSKYLKERAELAETVNNDDAKNEKDIYQSNHDHNNNDTQDNDDRLSSSTSSSSSPPPSSHTVKPSTTSFKTKLEAILKRGPSYRVTRVKVVETIKNIEGTSDKKRNSASVRITNDENSKKETVPMKNTNVIGDANEKSISVDDSKKKFLSILKSFQDKTQISNKQKFIDSSSSRPSTIEEALKRLKPVAKITSSSN